MSLTLEEFSESIFFHLVHFFTREGKKRGEEEKRVEREREGMGEGVLICAGEMGLCVDCG